MLADRRVAFRYLVYHEMLVFREAVVVQSFSDPLIFRLMAMFESLLHL